MAHFAKINENNIVENIIVVHNDSINNLPFPESEKIGQDFIASLNIDGKWIQCSYNGNFRKRHPSTGMIYDPIKDEFLQISDLEG